MNRTVKWRIRNINAKRAAARPGNRAAGLAAFAFDEAGKSSGRGLIDAVIRPIASPAGTDGQGAAAIDGDNTAAASSRGTEVRSPRVVIEPVFPQQHIIS